MSTINKIIQPIANKIPESNRLERIWKLAEVGFKKRYYNDRLGLLWALLNPALRITVYYLVFTHVLERGREGIDNFAIFIYAGLLLWLAFNEGATAGMRTLKSNKHLIQNIQFNHIDLFISGNLSVFMGLAFNTVVYLLICLFFQLPMGIDLWFIIPIYINLFLILMGSSMILATIKVYVEDITHLWAVITLIGFWSSGIFFPASMILEKFYPMLYINPFVGMIDNLRRITMWGQAPNYTYALINFIGGIVIFLIGYFFFKNYSHKAMERL
jgi:ABC-type polysaccharide/polyol phosphate export permease